MLLFNTLLTNLFLFVFLHLFHDVNVMCKCNLFYFILNIVFICDAILDNFIYIYITLILVITTVQHLIYYI